MDVGGARRPRATVSLTGHAFGLTFRALTWSGDTSERRPAGPMSRKLFATVTKSVRRASAD